MYDLDQLSQKADEAEKMQPSELLGQQCLDFAEFIERTKWHHEVRSEAKEIAKKFRRTYRFCVEYCQRCGG